MGRISPTGLNQPSHSANMSSCDDGSSPNLRSAEARRWSHGRAHNTRHHDATKVPIEDGRIRLSESHCHAEPTQWKQQCGIGNDSRAVHAMSAEFCRTKLPPVTWSFF